MTQPLILSGGRVHTKGLEKLVLPILVAPFFILGSAELVSKDGRKVVISVFPPIFVLLSL